MPFTEKRILVTNIQRFSLHDGPGIRTTVFLKGCSLRCPWCCNPENLTDTIQYYVKDGKRGKYGEYYTIDKLYVEIIKDLPFYGSCLPKAKTNSLENMPGGVTFSGGECILQIFQLLPLITRLNSKHVHVAVETCLFVPRRYLLASIQVVDLFYVDIKILNQAKCRVMIQGDLPLYLSNLDLLMSTGKPVVFRIPVIGGFTDDDENIGEIAKLIGKYTANNLSNLLKIELIKEHTLGVQKYESLSFCNKGYDVPKYRGVTDIVMENIRQLLIEKTQNTIPIEICTV